MVPTDLKQVGSCQKNREQEMQKGIREVRSRKSGWKKPPNTVYVGRPTKFGNPFRLFKGKIYGDASHRGEPFLFLEDAVSSDAAQKRAIELYADWIAGKNPYNVIPCPFTVQDMIDELEGYNLACWCKLTDDAGNHFPCHVDVLLKHIYG